MIKSMFKHGALIPIIVVFLLLRLAVIFTSIDKIHLDEELYRGNIAKEILSGPILPLFDYQRSEYEGSSLAIGILAIPFFIIFGETLLSLKIAILFLSGCLLIIWYLFFKNFFHPNAALLAGLFWVCSPPYYTEWQLLYVGPYFTASLFTILAFYILYELMYVKKRRLLLGYLGVLCGFALYYCYTFSITLVVIVVFMHMPYRRFLLSTDFLFFMLCFFAGFSPWIYYNMTHNFEGLIVADRPIIYWFSQHTIFDVISRCIHIVT